MSYNYRDLITGVLRDLDDPDIHHPSPDLILQACGDVGQMLHNQMQNTAIAWNIASTKLPSNNVDGRYLIAAPNFGKALRLAVTSSASDWAGSLQVDIVDRQNLLAFQQNTYTWRTNDGYGPFTTGQVATLEWISGSPYLELHPDGIPADCEMRLWYEVGEADAPALDGNFLPQVKAFHPYARLLMSARCVRYAEWSRLTAGITDPSTRYNLLSKRRGELESSLLTAALAQKEDWEEYVATNRQSGTTNARGYAESEEYPMYGDNYLGA